jgi:uncharacterized membrane protein YozB (DUF420 family)
VELGPHVILALKIAVSVVTLLFLCSLVALARGNYRLHGRINLAFFTLTLAALLGLELIVQVLRPDVFDYLKQNEQLHRALRVHLCFSVPATLVMPAMLYTGLTHRRRAHLTLAVVFGVLWTGTVVTGLFFLPHGY